MNRTAGIVIVVVLVFIVGVIVAVKENNKAELAAGALENPVENTLAEKPGEFKALPRLVDLGSDRCLPCKAMMPTLKELKTDYAGIFTVEFIDVWKNPDEANKYGVEIIPTQIFFDAAGKELFRHTGFFSKEAILAKWKQLGIDIEQNRK